MTPTQRVFAVVTSIATLAFIVDLVRRRKLKEEYSWLWIVTAEGSAARDTLTVTVRDAGGNLLRTLATYSNRDASSGYLRRSFDLGAFRGQTVRLQLHGVENGSRATSFLVDDATLTITQ